jgi:hypothetical protein
MRRIISSTLLAAALFVSRGASAQVVEGTTSPATRGAGIGVGGAVMITGLAGPSLAFDAGPFHIDGMIGLSKVEGVPADFGLGGRFWFKLHRTANSDFSLGGGLAFLHDGGVGPAGDDDLVFLEGGGQLRAFIAGNVALSVSFGLGIALVDRTAVALEAQPFGAAGIHYYFF